MSDRIDAFISGLRERCAGLPVDVAVRVVEHVLSTKSADFNMDSVRQRLGGYADKAYGAALHVPTPALLSAAGAAASVPLTAMFGRRDENGKKRYGRNALLGGALAVAAPMIRQPKWLTNHLQNRYFSRQMGDYRAEKRPVLESMARIAQEPFDKSQPVASLERTLNAARIQKAINDPYFELAKTYGDPAKRWRHLLGPVQRPGTEAYLKLPTFRRLEELAGPYPTPFSWDENANAAEGQLRGQVGRQ